MTETQLHRVQVCEEDFDQHRVYVDLVDAVAGQVGAVVTFVGLVRDYAGDGDAERRQVDTLTLEHYPGMTEKSISAIVDQARDRWPLLASHVIHRVGEMRAKDQIVMVAIASAHRDAAFAAAEFVMDYLKTDAVFWKRESGSQGSRWIESTDADRVRQAGWND